MVLKFIFFKGIGVFNYFYNNLDQYDHDKSKFNKLLNEETLSPTLSQDDNSQHFNSLVDKENLFDLFKKILEDRKINGKKLQILDLTDLNDLLLANQNDTYSRMTLQTSLIFHKAIQTLIQFRYDLKFDTMHNLLINTNNKLKCLLKLLIDSQSIYFMMIGNSSNTSTSVSEINNPAKREFIRSSSQFLSTTYRKLINWLVRSPFTKIQQFVQFRDELNKKIMQFIKLFRNKNKLNFSSSNDEELKSIVSILKEKY